MTTFSLILRFAAVAGTISSIVIYLLIGDKKEVLDTRLALTQKRLDGVETERDQIEVERNMLASELEKLDAQLGDAKAKGDTLLQQNIQARSEMSGMRNKVESVRVETGKQEEEIVRLRRELVSLKTAVPLSGLVESSEYAAQIEEQMRQIAELESELREYQDLIARRAANPTDLQDSLAGTGKQNESERRVAAEVIAIGREAFFFAINAGSSSGLKPERRYTVYRGNEAIVKVLLINVRPEFCIAQVLPKAGDAGQLRTGDIVALKVEQP